DTPEPAPEPTPDPGRPHPAPNNLETSAGTTAAPPRAVATNAPVSKPAPVASPSKGRAFPWMGGFVASLLGLAGLIAWEISRWFSRRTGEIVLSENAPAATDEEYEAAEAEWTNGNHLEAVRMMREYLDKNPSEQYAAIRIAEIYEKDLHNYVAASLELEEVLTKRLSREKWGWTAIHLANLYSGKMNQPDKAIAWLERIIRDYPETGAAKKARARLGVSDEAAAPQPDPEVQSEPEPGDSHLPKGFSSKKR
ncbi:MAG: tetratricopeptide repeat protein, partial [Verrucomicrobiota bacterium]